MGFQFIDNQPVRFSSFKFDDQACINKDLSAYNILMKPGDPLHWQAKLKCCEAVNIACNASAEGDELVTDGDMSNAAAFTLGTGWAIAAGVATLTATGTNGALLQTGLATTTGAQYVIRVTINSNTTGFGVDVYLGGRRIGQVDPGLTGLFEFYGTSGSTGSIQVQSSNDYSNALSGTLVIDNLSVKNVASCYTFDTSAIEYVVNGSFTGSSDGWALGAGWTWVNAANDYTEHTTPASLLPVLQTITGITHRADILFAITISNRTVGGIDYYYGETFMASLTTNAVHTFNYAAFGLNNDFLKLYPVTGFDGRIDDISATETQSGWSYDPDNGFCHTPGWANAFYAGATIIAGHYYKMIVEVIVNQGSVTIEAGGVVLGIVNKTGVYPYYFTAITTDGEKFTPSFDFDGCILDTIDICRLFRTVLQARLVYEDGVTGATDWHTTSSSSNPVILEGEWVTWRINSLAAILSGGVPVALNYSCYRMQVKVECDPADPVSISTSTSDTVINYSATQPCTKLFMSYCNGHALDFNFGYYGDMFRIYMRLRTLYFNPVQNIDAEDYEFSSGIRKRMYATRIKKYEALFDYCDEYAHDVIGLMIATDFMYIDNTQYIADAGTYEPDWTERGKRNLAQSTIELMKSDGIIFNRNCS